MTPIFKAPLLVLDTETTGLPRDDWAEVVELGCVLLDQAGREMSSWSSFVRPQILDDRCQPALSVNHIEQEDLEVADPPEKVRGRLHVWLEEQGYNQSPHVTSFNVEFDRTMLERSGFRLRWANCIMLRAQEEMGPAGALPPAPERLAARGQRWKWPSLAEAASFYAIDQATLGVAHRALADARTAAAIAIAIASGGRAVERS